MDDRTRTHGHAQGVHQHNSDPGIGGLAIGAMLAVILGALLVAGLTTAIGTWPAVIVSTLAFAGLVWVLIPTSEAPNLHAERLLDDRGLRSAKTTPPGKHIRRGLTVACLGGVCGIVMSVVPGCAESPANVAAFEALDTNRQQLDPMTLRGIADAESTPIDEGGISSDLADQYRGLLSDHNALIDALLGRPAEGAGVVVEPESADPKYTP